ANGRLPRANVERTAVSTAGPVGSLLGPGLARPRRPYREALRRWRTRRQLDLLEPAVRRLPPVEIASAVELRHRSHRASPGRATATWRPLRCRWPVGSAAGTMPRPLVD